MTELSSAVSNVHHTAERTAGPRHTTWVAVVVFGLVDLLWSAYEALSFFRLERVLLAIVLMISLSWLYGASRRSLRLANMAHYAGLWIAFTITGAVFTYLAATFRLPLRDPELAAVDGWLRFDWVAWFRFVGNSPILRVGLGLAYSSLFVQILVSIFYFCHVDKPDRNQELWSTAAVSLLITALLSALIPAAGAGVYFGASDLPNLTYLPHFLALRDGTLTHIAVENMQGIVTFPSYHTVLAVLLTYAYRGQGHMLFAIAALNVLMLLSIPVYGSHYLSDMLAGALIALLSIYLLKNLSGHHPASAATPSHR